LFLLYINDLPRTITTCQVLLYADDTTLIVHGKCLSDVITTANNVLHQVSLWLMSNKITINTSKCSAIYFNRPDQQLQTASPLTISGETISFENCSKLLGIHIDAQLNWHQHIDNLCKKLNRALYALRCLTNIVSQKVLLVVYNAYFLSLIRYGIILWGGSAAAHKVFILQKKAIRLINNPRTARRKPSCRTVFQHLGLLTLPSLYILECVLYVKEHSELSTKNYLVHQHNTRQKNLLHVAKVRSNILLKGCLRSCQSPC
jgi:hypothetical protein